jgi:molybdate transport system substrate-binding protein
MIQELGIADQLNRRATMVERGFVADAVVDCRADLAVQSLSELQSVPEVDIIGPLPGAVQLYTVLCAALGACATEKPEAINLLRALAGNTAEAAYLQAGPEVAPISE